MEGGENHPYAETLGSIELQYAGKQSTESILASPAAQTELKEVVARQRGNRIYFGRTWPLWRDCLKDPSVCGKVQLFYIDPPYATQAVYHSRSEKAAYIDLLRGGLHRISASSPDTNPRVALR